MPPLPPPGEAQRRIEPSFSVSFLAAGGERATISLEISPDAGAAAQVAVANAVGSLSNAAVYAYRTSLQTSVRLSSVNPFNEAWAGASEKLVLTFENADFVQRSIAIPAPDESYFAADGLTLNAGNPTVAAALADIEAALNAGDPAGTFVYLTGYRASYKRRSQRRPRVVRPVVEPGPGDLPPALPPG